MKKIVTGIVASIALSAAFLAPAVTHASDPFGIDPSIPLAVTGIGSHTTATFTPPAGAVILVMDIAEQHSLSQIQTPSDNLALHLTYHNIASGPFPVGTNTAKVQAWWAVTTESKPMTVTVSVTDPRQENMLRVIVMSGADTANPIGAGGGGSGQALPLVRTYSIRTIGSWGFLLYGDGNQAGAPATSSAETLDSADNVAGHLDASIFRTTSNLGGVAMLTATPPASGTAEASYLFFEVLPVSTPTSTAADAQLRALLFSLIAKLNLLIAQLNSKKN